MEPHIIGRHGLDLSEIQLRRVTEESTAEDRMRLWISPEGSCSYFTAAQSGNPFAGNC